MEIHFLTFRFIKIIKINASIVHEDNFLRKLFLYIKVQKFEN